MFITAISAGSHDPAVPKEENCGKLLELMDWTSGAESKGCIMAERSSIWDECGCCGCSRPGMGCNDVIFIVVLDFNIPGKAVFVVDGEPEVDPRVSLPYRIGRSILPVLAETSPLEDWGQIFGSHTFHEITNYWPTRMMRNRRYKYHRNIAWRLDFPFAADIYGSLTWEEIRNADTSPKMIGSRPLKHYFFRPAEELYDIQADPNEVRNLANDAEYQSVLEDMRAALEEWQRRMEDAWLFRDGVSLLFVRHHLEAGFEVPDRIDFDVDAPESKGQPIFNGDMPWGAVAK
ncbi:Alkaline phosphatase-like alpha/beta/alpha [Penicillium cf. viridicatum]|uniref:Alkaline phosphatase-like alpha/beta/alpha n=1 Tax=Penicillium cf. viridicatum TaxID=2972119 RepID=A0A9W9IZD8_9EURO|nr:Alkaline phosphatase-like alpha/beta/alpha [Penicillium cf. viridicatum]